MRTKAEPSKVEVFFARNSWLYGLLLFFVIIAAFAFVDKLPIPAKKYYHEDEVAEMKAEYKDEILKLQTRVNQLEYWLDDYYDEGHEEGHEEGYYKGYDDGEENAYDEASRYYEDYFDEGYNQAYSTYEEWIFDWDDFNIDFAEALRCFWGLVDESELSPFADKLYDMICDVYADR